MDIYIVKTNTVVNVNFLEFAKKRRTTYEFSGKKIENQQIMTILEAGRWAPSCSNSQPWHFIVIEDKKRISKIMNTAYYGAFHTDPAVIIALVFKNDQLKDDKHICGYEAKISKAHGHECIGMAGLNMAYMAQELGIDSCFLTPAHKEIAKLLKLGDFGECMLMVGLGYEEEGAFKKVREREPINDIVSYEYLEGHEK